MPEEEGLPHERVRFAHNSERQFAKLLDFYGIEWEYEPVEFTLEWTRRGQPASAFRPDFYLRSYDLFIEITTLNQKLVTKKNRKVKRLKELYPAVDVKVLYQRDYLNLLAKYGLEQPSQMQHMQQIQEPVSGEEQHLVDIGRARRARRASPQHETTELLQIGRDLEGEVRRRLAR